MSEGFLTHPFLVQYSGDQESLASEPLGRLFSMARSVSFIWTDHSFATLAALTWGLSHADLTSSTFRIFVCPDPEGADQPHFTPANTVEAKRIGWLRHLLETGKLDLVHIPNPPEGTSRVLFTDSTGLVVTASIRQSISISNETDDHTAHLDWPLGNPAKRVEKLIGLLDQAEASSPECIRIVEELRKYPAVLPPFEESFASGPTQLVPGYDLYQHQICAIKNWQNRGWRGIFAMCTGSGKTIAALGGVVTAAQHLKAEGKDLPVVIVAVPKKILADQWVWVLEDIFSQAALRAYGSKANWGQSIGAYLAQKPSEFPRFIVTTYATFSSDFFVNQLLTAGRNGRLGMLIADEMHNLASTSQRQVLKRLEEFFPIRLGLSATPEIEGNPSATAVLENYFGDKPPNYCGSYELKDGIREGVLCHYRYYPLPAFLDPSSGRRYLEILEALEKTEEAGNSPGNLALYNQRRDILRKSTLPIERLNVWLRDRRARNASCRQLLAYCPPGNIAAEAESDDSDTEPELINLLKETTRVIDSHGLTVTSIVGQTSEKDRRNRLQEFKSGEWNCLCAIGCLDEGVDVPAIERAVVLYSIDRERQFIQRRGRILRRDPENPSKIAEIFDVILLPDPSLLGTANAQRLLAREMRRYREFAELADNRDEAENSITQALQANDANSVISLASD